MKHKQMKKEKSKAHMLEGLAKDWDRLEDTRRQQKQHRMSIVAWDIWDYITTPKILQPPNITTPNILQPSKFYILIVAWDIWDYNP